MEFYRIRRCSVGWALSRTHAKSLFQFEESTGMRLRPVPLGNATRAGAGKFA
ncbi:hypothetical protein EC9_21550 [Rosistilla ulvae]|uniref:Uncharacterized protein n=1 Tax=Rosistilla ulvae TaxID=1930277 RepID=A0A517LZC7_9BACT|nr:hypothetical protein EC9_21550 [Rosistilla ulvae]